MPNPPSLATFKSHQISQTLLKQFCGKANDKCSRPSDGKIRVFDKRTGQSKLKTKGAIGFLEASRELLGSLEKDWGKIENKFNAVISHIEDETFFNSPEDLATVRGMIGLHFIRSFLFQRMLGKAETESFIELLNQVQDKVIEQQAFRVLWLNDLVEMVPQMMKEHMKKALKIIESCKIEIAEAPSGHNFILGDTPVVNLTMDGRVGLQEGVGLSTSDIVFMPLSPRYAASLTQKHSGRHIKLNLGLLRFLNKKTKHQAIRWFYAVPL